MMIRLSRALWDYNAHRSSGQIIMPLTPLAFSPTENARYKARLIARQRELTSRLSAIEADFEQPRNPDADDRAMERSNDEVLDKLGVSGQQELRAIDAALDRLRKGTYGTCAKCSAPIEAARLDALPQTPFCHACAHSL
jgi:RNA polymerase-binding transcription factor DksA